MKLRLQRVLRIGVTGALAICLVSAGLVVAWHLTDDRRQVQALAGFDRFALSLRLMAAVSDERAPADRLMGAATGASPEDVRALAAARMRVDALAAGLSDRFAGETVRQDTLRRDLATFRTVLAEGRAAVDAAVARRGGGPASGAVAPAVRAMFRAGDSAQALRDDLGGALVALSPELTPLLTAAVCVVDLGDYAGRIGSLVLVRMAAGGQADAETADAFAAMLALTDRLQRQIENHTLSFLSDAGLERAVSAVTFGFFAGARPYAETLFSDPLASATVSATTFRDRYAPGLRSVEALRDAFLAVAHAKLAAGRDESLRLAILSIFGAGVLGLTVLVWLLVLERGVFRPLRAAHERMARILAGDLEAAGAPASAFVEIAALERDVETLRRHQIDLRRLEEERETLSRELRRLASTDPLTGLLNRRAFEAETARLFADPRALGAGLGIVMIDIDRFKSINDRFGHAAGDEVLRAVGRFLGRKLPPGALVARFGGEEFVVALPDIGRRDLGERVEALRARLEAARILDKPRLRITASFGVHWVPAGRALDWDTVQRVADDHLYRAKRDGRNRVACSAA